MSGDTADEDSFTLIPSPVLTGLTPGERDTLDGGWPPICFQPSAFKPAPSSRSYACRVSARQP